MIAAASSNMWTVGIFPFETELGKIVTEDDTVLLVDIGGGKGQATRQIKQMCPNIKGRMILQDRPQVTSTITEEMPGIEVMAYDFFTPQPIKGTLTSSYSHSFSSSHCYHSSSSSITIETRNQQSHRRSNLLHPTLPTRLALSRLHQDPEEHCRRHGAGRIPPSYFRTSSSGSRC